MNKIAISVSVAAAAAQLLAVPSDARRDECEARAREIVAQQTAMDCVAFLGGCPPARPQFGIPRYSFWNEALHGIARCGLATVFPQTIGRAATFDTALEREVADAIAIEARAKYNLFRAKELFDLYTGLTLWSPNVNMFRDPRWGRGQETFGEDPYLAARMGVEFVKGLQGDDPNFLMTAACAKHYAVHSGPEAKRHGFNVNIDKRDLYEYYLPAFKALVQEAKVESVMGAYSAVNGVPCCASKYLLRDILRDEWGFRGHVVSDVGACTDVWTQHKYTKDALSAALACIDGGLDLCNDGTYGPLRPAIERGEVKKERLVQPVVNLLTTRLLLGNIGNAKTPWDGLGEKDIATKEHIDLALRCAEKSFVLLKNNGVLPLDRAKCRRIQMWGRYKDETALLGNYNGQPGDPLSIYRAFLRELGPGALVEEGHGGDVTLACIGLTPADEGEGGDRKHINLKDDQLKTLRKDRKERPNQKIVSVVFGGSCVDLREVAELSDAVLFIWYPGEQCGKAVYRTLFGMNNPGGRLPVTFYADNAKLPDFEDYKLPGHTYLYGEENVFYPFGYGLSYTTFGYDGLNVAKSNGGVTATVKVTNTGKVAGDEVVQLYVRSPKNSGDRRRHHLEGFKRVSLKPGESKTVSFTLKPEQMMQFGMDGKQSLAKGEYTVFVGGGQPGYAENVKNAQLTF